MTERELIKKGSERTRVETQLLVCVAHSPVNEKLLNQWNNVTSTGKAMQLKKRVEKEYRRYRQ